MILIEDFDFFEEYGEFQFGPLNSPTTRDITIHILEDSIFESELEYFTISLDTEDSGIEFVNNVATIYILDNDCKFLFFCSATAKIKPVKMFQMLLCSLVGVHIHCLSLIALWTLSLKK